MKGNSINIPKYSQLFLYSVLILLVSSSACFAAEEISDGKKLYASIMTWVNVGIMIIWLRFVIKKLTNKTVLDIIRGEGDKISEQLLAVEADLKDARSRMEEESEKLKKIDGDLENITRNIIAAGSREKENIIKKARALGEKMVEDARKEAEFKMEAARKRFSEEMLEMAVQITVENIKKNITGEDDKNLITAFSSRLNSEQKLFA